MSVFKLFGGRLKSVAAPTLIFLSFLLSLVLASLSLASANLGQNPSFELPSKIKIYHPENKTIEIGDLGWAREIGVPKLVHKGRSYGKLFELQLVSNTDVCFQRCEAVIRVRPYITIDLSKLPKLVRKELYKWNFYDRFQNPALGKNLRDYWMELRVNESYEVRVPIYENVSVERTLTCDSLTRVNESFYECSSSRENRSPFLIRCDWVCLLYTSPSPRDRG